MLKEQKFVMKMSAKKNERTMEKEERRETVFQMDCMRVIVVLLVVFLLCVHCCRLFLLLCLFLKKRKESREDELDLKEKVQKKEGEEMKTH